MSIDTRVDADPTSLDASVVDLESSISTISNTADTIVSVRQTMSDQEGSTAAKAVASLGYAINGLDDLEKDVTSYKNAVSTFAGQMRKTQGDFADLVARASGGGLTVSGTTVLEPTADADDAKVSLYSTLSEWAYDIRTAEACARDEFEAACRAIDSTPVADAVRGAFAPTDPTKGLAFGINRLGNAFTLARGLSLRGPGAFFQTSISLGRNGSGGLMLTDPPTNKLKLFFAKGKLDNWFNSSPNAMASKASSFLQKAKPAMKWVGRVGTAVTAVTSFVDQYQADSRNPSMGEGEKITRATVKSATTTTGAYLGAKGGALLGASIGAVGGPVGVAVGGIIGGIAGGIIGSGIGSKFGDLVNSRISSILH